MSQSASLLLAAKSIRAELRLKFPGVKFRVRSHSFANGNSVDVLWAGGPETSAVQAITTKYEEGTFDGMIDGYVPDEDPQHKEFHRLRGSAKYVMLHRREARGAA